MTRGARRLQGRKAALKKLNDILVTADHVVVIHYSCESFYDRPDGSSPRITSIAVANLASQQTHSFSIHQLAERKGLPLCQIGEHYDELERQMLDEFYDYVRSRNGYTWLHWNMRNIHYGFQALAHRHKVLGGQPVEIPEPNLADLARLLPDIYGVRYMGHPRMQKLVERNSISAKDFLTGAQEAEAFQKGEYVKLHFSTLRKVDIISTIVHRAAESSLHTDSNWREVYGSYGEALADWLAHHWQIQVIRAVIDVVAFAVVVYQILLWLQRP